MPAVTVETAPVSVGPLTETIQAVGTLQSNESVVIKSEIAGRIVRIPLAEGAKVRQGDVLVELDPTMLRAELSQAEANLRLAESNASRTQSLYGSGASTARANDEARARLATERAALELARARLEKATIVAPFDGRLGLRAVSVGALVGPADRLVNLESIDPLKVDFRLPENVLAKLRVGQRISVTVDALPGKSFDGEIYAIDPQVDVSGRAIRLRARIPNSDDALAPGLFARIAVAAEVRQNAITVPEAAIVPRDRERYVFRIEDGRAVFTKVEIGVRRLGRVEVVSGLAPDAVVVVAGQLKLRDGARVEIVKQAETAPGQRS